MRSLPPSDLRASEHPVDVGQRTEAVIACELMARGYSVLTPLGFNHRYDLVLDCGGVFVRVQCKTGRLRNGVILFAARSTRCNMNSVSTREYVGEADMFMVYCRETEGLYAVPIEDVKATGGRLRVASPANGQKTRIRWASDYELAPNRQPVPNVHQPARRTSTLRP
jgi:hypothetical protein